MIPCIFRSNGLIKAGLQKTSRIVYSASCQYSTNEESKSKFNDFLNDSSHIDKTQDKNSKNYKGTSSDRRDFSDLLGALFDESMNPREPFVASVTPPPKSRHSETVIEQKLLKLLEKNPYKLKAPVPESMVNAFYRGSENEEEKQADNDNILDSVEPFDYSWYREKVAQDERIKMKEKEVQIRETILGAKSINEALEIISKEINQNAYPLYYPNIVKTTLDYAAKIDPYLTLSIFEQVKAKSIQSYISGCTVETYNTILLLRWDTWRDVHGMLDLLEEMSVNGVQVDAVTRSIVGKAVREIDQDNGFADDQGLYWGQDEKRSCNIMKEMANKWLIKN